MSTVEASDSSRIVALGAICSFQLPRDPDESTVRFAVGEFVQWADGTRTALHADRGLTARVVSHPNAEWRGPVWTSELLRQQVLNVVMPDEDNGEAHPWEWLARLAHQRGLNLSPADLRAVPYLVEFAEPVTDWLRAQS